MSGRGRTAAFVKRIILAWWVIACPLCVLPSNLIAQQTAVEPAESTGFYLDGAEQAMLLGDPSIEEPPLVLGDHAIIDAVDPRAEPIELRAGYDRGFFITSDDAESLTGKGSESFPFLLRVNLQNQFRYNGFARTEREWTDAAGNVNPIANRNDFEIHRGRLLFSGHAIDRDLNYYVNLDYATLGDDRVTILLAWLNYRFNRAFDLYFGKGKVPGGREWLLTSMYTMSPDRSMATTFFRPSITTGIWAKGEPIDQLYYQAMVGNGFSTSSAGFRDLDTNFVYSANTWWEPLGAFGGLYSDLDYHETLAVRWGSSLTTSRQSGRQFDTSAPEETFIRLSDGTDLTEPGALAPGVSVTDYSLYLATFDAAMKYRGVSVSGEYFLRWLTEIRGTAAIPDSRDNIFDHGLHFQAGAFVVPKRCELFTRTSYVLGPLGNGSEYAGGFNWFFRGTENWRFCFDVTRLNNSPAEQIRTGYSAGASGVLVRGQLQTMF